MSRLRADEINYLVFEGGGGKGFATVGAIEALEHRRVNVLRYTNNDPYTRRIDDSGTIRGIAGTSAGSIVATALACGYNSRDIRNLMSQTVLIGGRRISVFSLFTKIPDIRQRNIIRPQIGITEGAIIGERYRSSSTGDFFFEPNIIRVIVNSVANATSRTLQIGDGDRSILEENLRVNYGMYNGGIVRQWVNRFIKDKFYNLWHRSTASERTIIERDLNLNPHLRLNSSTMFDNVTFLTHKLLFKCDLAICSVNISRATSEVFSVYTTPHMCVADAVRMSMSIPLLFMPVNIDQTVDNSNRARPVSPFDSFTNEHGTPIIPQYPIITNRLDSFDRSRNLTDEELQGYWIDGGIYANLPFFAFGGLNTLGIRLDVNERSFFTNFSQFISGLGKGVLGAGEGLGSRSWIIGGLNGQHNIQECTIPLNTEGLEMVNFTPSANIRDRRIRDAKVKVLDYFNIHE